jgi:hypothetical protein
MFSSIGTTNTGGDGGAFPVGLGAGGPSALPAKACIVHKRNTSKKKNLSDTLFIIFKNSKSLG